MCDSMVETIDREIQQKRSDLASVHNQAPGGFCSGYCMVSHVEAGEGFALEERW